MNGPFELDLACWAASRRPSDVARQARKARQGCRAQPGPSLLRHTYPVDSAFNIVIFAVIGLALVIALAVLIARRGTWDDFGKGGLVMDRDSSDAADRDTEIRQLLEARNERRARRGEAPIDVDDELARLTTPAPSVDPALREEIRQLVVARNHRRVRAGKPPLDVESEIEREIAGLSGL